ncbi:MAG: tetratricopeptide repeat protein [Calditrichaeota bacterium]|nr:tetratricopeptide repeat protein [Calditrichota bacterium]
MSKVDEIKQFRSEIEKFNGVEKAKHIISLCEKGNLPPEFQIEILNQAAGIAEKLEISQEKMRIYFNLSKVILTHEQDLPKSKEFLNKALTECRSLADEEFEIKILNRLGLNAFDSGDFYSSLDILKEALSKAENSGDLSMIAHIHNHISIGYWRISELEKALKHCFKALKISDDIGEIHASANANLNLGNIFGLTRDLKNALEHYKKAFTQYEELDLKERMAMTNNGISMIYNMKGEFEKALEITRQSLEIGKSINNKQLICICTNNIGANYRQMRNMEKALKYFTAAIKLAEEGNLSHMAASFSQNVSNIYGMQNDFENGLKYLDIALKYVLEMNNEEMLMHDYQLRSQFLKLKGEFEASLELHEKYTDLSNKLDNEKRTKHINELTKKYELEKKEKEAEIFRLKNVELAEANQKLKDAQSKIAHLAHLSGKAEVAVSVIHNIGNVLNSAVTSSVLISESLVDTNVDTLRRTVNLIGNLDISFKKFVSDDPRGEKLPELLNQITDSLEEEIEQHKTKMKTISKSLDHIKSIIDFHQLHSISSESADNIDINKLLNNIIGFIKPSFDHQKVDLSLDLPKERVMLSTKTHKLEEIIINLLQNALESFVEFEGAKQTVILSLATENNQIHISVKDNGKGIATDKLESVFQYGFTTKSKSHGLGLHSCALSAKDLGAMLSVNSEGKGCGADFNLIIPTKNFAGTQNN